VQNFVCPKICMFYATVKLYVVLHYFVFELNYVCKQTEPPYKTQLMLKI